MPRRDDIHVIYRKADREIMEVAVPPLRAFVALKQVVAKHGGKDAAYGVVSVPRRIWRMRGRRQVYIDAEGKLRFGGSDGGARSA
jgi:hypothetical protein